MFSPMARTMSRPVARSLVKSDPPGELQGPLRTRLRVYLYGNGGLGVAGGAHLRRALSGAGTSFTGCSFWSSMRSPLRLGRPTCRDPGSWLGIVVSARRSAQLTARAIHFCARAADLSPRSTRLAARSTRLGARAADLRARSTRLSARAADLAARAADLGG